jgi:hypothetical protein
MFLSCCRMPNHSQRWAEANRGTPRCANGFYLITDRWFRLLEAVSLSAGECRSTACSILSKPATYLCGGRVERGLATGPTPVASNGREHTLAAFTLSTNGAASPAAAMRPASGSSTFTASPSWPRAYAVTPTSRAQWRTVSRMFSRGRAEVSARRASGMLFVADAERALLRPVAAQISARCVHVAEVWTLNQSGSFVPSISTRSGGSSQS